MRTRSTGRRSAPGVLDGAIVGTASRCARARHRAARRQSADALCAHGATARVRNSARVLRRRGRAMTNTGRQRQTQAADTRRLAIDALVRIDNDGAYANFVLPSMLQRSRLDTRDRAFVDRARLRNHSHATGLRLARRSLPARAGRASGARRAAARCVPVGVRRGARARGGQHHGECVADPGSPARQRGVAQGQRRDRSRVARRRHAG